MHWTLYETWMKRSSSTSLIKLRFAFVEIAGFFYYYPFQLLQAVGLRKAMEIIGLTCGRKVKNLTFPLDSLNLHKSNVLSIILYIYIHRCK